MRQLAYGSGASPGERRRGDALVLIGRALLRVRIYRGWRQRQLERITGIDQTTISRLERGARPGLSIRRLAAMLEALDVAEIEFKPARPLVLFSNDEQLLQDAWLRAGRYADELLRRPRRTRTTISTRPSSETTRGPLEE